MKINEQICEELAKHINSFKNNFDDAFIEHLYGNCLISLVALFGEMSSTEIYVLTSI